MKLFVPIFLGVFAFFSIKVDANGVCYDPNHTSGKNDLTVQADMKIIASAGFTSVRTYLSKFDNTELGPIIAAAGLTAVLGVPYPYSGYQEQMEAAIKAANAGGVSIIMVGNENLAGVSSVPRDMIDVINQIKARVSVKVGTVQRNTEVIGWQGISGWPDLVAACDVFGANVQPLFTPGITAESAIDIVDEQWKTMKSQFGDKLILAETGWASRGFVSGNTCSLSGEQAFYNAYQHWSSGMREKFYFQMFDTPGKAEVHEQTFGLYTADMQPKFPMSQQQPAPIPNSTTPALPPTPPTPPPPTPATTPPSLERSATFMLVPETNSGLSETKVTFSSLLKSDDVVQQESGSFSDPVHTMEVSSYFKSPISSTESPKNRSDYSRSRSESEHITETPKKFSESEHVSETTLSVIGNSVKSQQAQPANKNENDDTQEINTQSKTSSFSGVVGLAVGGAACAVLLAFGFIYHARKRAQELEDEATKDGRISTITPVQDICSL
ncbi:unnamed protein product [Peronospora destructor]|uniref:glucan endo-1,3-beta-D-glucosidase n=1 Tax=Peronospora destructor TaxID=86335 RepID=A0AAV0TFA4_9STRA|nr:unnamed protein product [Peronospora destructor]